MEAVFKVDGAKVVTRGHAAGPWREDLQHGSAAAGLTTWAIEQLPTAAPMQLARLTIGFFRPVPVADLVLKAAVLRHGRRIQVSAARLFLGEVELANASALHIRTADLDLPPFPDTGGPAAAPEQLPPPRLSLFPSPFLSGVSMRTEQPERIAGPRAIWFRLDRPLIEGLATSPVVRAAMTADLCNGTGAVLDRRTGPLSTRTSRSI